MSNSAVRLRSVNAHSMSVAPVTKSLSFEESVTNLSAEISVAIDDQVSCVNSSVIPLRRSSLFDKILSDLQESEQPVIFFHALSNNAYKLYKNHKECEELLALLFLFDWSCKLDVAEAFGRLLVSLTSASAGFIEPCFQLLLQNLLPAEEDDDDEGDEIDSQISSGKPQNTDATHNLNEDALAKSKAIHKTIQRILRNAPLGVSVLLNVIISSYPYNNESLARQKTYLQEILKITDYVSVFKDKVFALIFDRFLLMDVEIRIEDLLSKERTKDTENDAMFKMEEDENNREESQMEVDSGKDREAIEQIRNMADKLDVLLVVFMDYCDMHCSKGLKHAKNLFQLLLNLFDRYILRTRNTRFTQFIIFHVCRKKAEFVDSYIERLLQYSLSSVLPLEIRLRSAEYIASFLSRALYVRVDSVESTLTYLIRWVHSYIEEHLKSTGMFIPQENVQYLKICQAVIYIIIYKGEEIRKEFLEEMNWISISQVQCSPFPYLPDYLVLEFVKFAFQNNIAIAKANASIEDTVEHLCDKKDERVNASFTMDLAKADTSFPFDPCLLERTSKLIENEYQGWFSTEEGHDVYVFESENENFTTDDESSDEEFGSENILVPDSKLPAAIRIPKITSAALNMIGAGSLGTTPPALYWGFGGRAKKSSPTMSYGTRSMVSSIGSFQINMKTPASVSSRTDNSVESGSSIEEW